MNLPQYYRTFLQGFKRVTQGFVLFNLIYLFLLATELCLFFAFLPTLLKSANFALALGTLFLTSFSYFVLFFYFQMKKPEQLAQLREQFLSSCKQDVSLQDHLSLAEALSKLSSYLDGFEKNFYKASKPFSKALSTFSSYCYRADVWNIKLLLQQVAIDEHLKQVKLTPTSLEVHASLASAYVGLSKIYKESLSQEKYRNATKLAIEEFCILSHYAPNDPWVHEQLATFYQGLDMPQEEMREVETLLKLKAQDKEVLYRLGLLYFKQGMNAKGLQVYEELKKAQFTKAEDLLEVYGVKK